MGDRKMTTKLTLSIDDTLKEHIKKYASEKKTDLSYLVAGLFKKILDDNQNKEAGITPLVKELIGVIPTRYSNNEIDNMYKKHLDEKYL